MKFPIFWFEGNLYFNSVESFDDLKMVLVAYDGTETVDAFFDKARNNPNSKDPYYGFRRECSGDKTLRQFFQENGIELPICGDLSIDEYLKTIKIT